MEPLLGKLLDAALSALGTAAAAAVPDAWKRRALAELRDRNPLAQIGLNHDLLRAVRLAWIEAALDVVTAAVALAKRPDWRGDADAIRGFSEAARGILREARTAALDTGRHPGASPIDAHARAVLAGVPEVVAPGRPAEHGAAIGAGFLGTLAALTGWPEAEIPAAFRQVAAAGLAVRGGPPRAFGDLVLAAFAEILKSPKRYPEAGAAFRIAMEGAARALADDTLAAVRGIDAAVDAALARLDRLAVAQDGLGRYLDRLPEIAAGVGRVDERTERIEAQAERIEAKVDALLASGRGRAVARESGLSGETLREAMLRLWAAGLGRDDLVAELERWLAKYLEERARGVNEDAAFQAALAEARRRVETGRLGDASAAFMAEFDRETAQEAERQEERRRRRLRLLEEAVRFDELALDGAAAAGKLRLMAEVEGAADADARGAWLFAKAVDFYNRGLDRGENSALLIAIAIYETILTEYTRAQAPLDWATTQNNLGNALQVLGERESGAARLKAAVRAYRAALAERTRERVPLDWAMTQNNLAAALQGLGRREASTEHLEEAVKTYRATLLEYTREVAPLDWAMTQNNLGNALQALGERESGTELLEAAVEAYRAALLVRTRESLPLKWATTQNNLGAVLQVLGKREIGTERLQASVEAYRAALSERTRELVPLDWAMTQNNLGNALRALGDRESGTERLEESVEAYRAALLEYMRERVPLDWAMTQNNLGNALRQLGEREGRTERFKASIEAYREALLEYTRERVPLLWAMTQNNLGASLRVLGTREADTERLEAAVEAYRAALMERTRGRVPLDWAMTTANFGSALMHIAERRADLGLAIEARDRIKDGLAVFLEASHPPFVKTCEVMLAAAEDMIERLSG